MRLLRRALNISEKHVIGGWPLYAGVCDERGDANFAMQTLAGIVDREYLEEHGAEMSVGELARKLEEAWGETIRLRTLRRWRERPCYWDRYRDDEE